MHTYVYILAHTYMCISTVVICACLVCVFACNVAATVAEAGCNLCVCREGYGYVSSRWRDPPSADIKYIRKRAMQINTTLQCGWSLVPLSSSLLSICVLCSPFCQSLSNRKSLHIGRFYIALFIGDFVALTLQRALCMHHMLGLN